MNLAALRSPGFRRYLIGNAFSLNGMWLARLTMAWLAWALTGQAGFVGLVAFLTFAPTLVSGPFFGVVADRIELRRAAILVQAGLGACALALFVAARAGVLEPALLAAVALAMGVVTSAHHPVRLALGPALVGRDAIASAVTLGSVNFNLARLTGPALGGLVIAGLGVDWALALAAAAFLPMTLLVPGLALRERRAPEGREAGLGAAFAAGLRCAAGTPLIRRAMAATLVFSLVGRGALEVLPALADGVFGRGAGGLGTLTAAAGAGALVAAAGLALAPGQAPGRLPRTSAVAAPLGLALVAALGSAPAWPLALALVAGLGLCGTLVGVGLQTAVQLVLPDAVRGRVMSLWTVVAIGGTALGALGLGALIDLVGPRAALGGAGALGLAAAALLLARPLAAGGGATTSRAWDAPRPGQAAGAPQAASERPETAP